MRYERTWGEGNVTTLPYLASHSWRRGSKVTEFPPRPAVGPDNFILF